MEAEEAGEKAEIESRDSAEKKKGGGQRTKSKLWRRRINFGGKSLVLLQVNCRNIYNEVLQFWNLVDTVVTLL